MASKFARFESSWLQNVGNIAREDVKKYASLIWTNWNSDWERSGTSWITPSLWQPSVSGIVDSSRSVMLVLYTFLQYFPHVVINWIQILQIWRPQLSEINSGVNIAVVPRARWAFQVSQGSVETLFRWGGKLFHHIAANLFRKLCTKFHHNCPSFVGDITENILVSFSRTQCTLQPVSIGYVTARELLRTVVSLYSHISYY